MNESNGRRPETTGRIVTRILDPNDRYTPGPQELERLGRAVKRYYLWPFALALALFSAIAGGSIWFYRAEQRLGQVERQGKAIRSMQWMLYRQCLAGGGRAAECQKPEDAP